jgi:hypothetical protein
MAFAALTFGKTFVTPFSLSTVTHLRSEIGGSFLTRWTCLGYNIEVRIESKYVSKFY